jgi:hypothetical protein
MDAVRRLVEALPRAVRPADPTAAVASPLTTVLLLLVTVALWRLLGWSRQLRRPGAKEATRSLAASGAARASHGGGGGGGGGGLPQQRGALAQVVRSHNEHWQHEMPKTGAVSLAQAHVLQWGADDIVHAGERSARAQDEGAEPGLPTYLWVVRVDPSREAERASERERQPPRPNALLFARC